MGEGFDAVAMAWPWSSHGLAITGLESVRAARGNCFPDGSSPLEAPPKFNKQADINWVYRWKSNEIPKANTTQNALSLSLYIYIYILESSGRASRGLDSS